MLRLTAVLNLNGGLATLADDLEGEVLDVGLHLGVVKFTADETLRIEDGVLGVHRGLVLGGIANQALLRGERDVGRRRPVTLCAKLSIMHSQ